MSRWLLLWRAHRIPYRPRAVLVTFTTGITMPSVSHAVGKFTHSVAEILGGLLNSIIAVFQSIYALGINTVTAFFAILRALFTGVVDLMSSTVGFILSKSALQSSFPLQLDIYSLCSCRQHLHPHCSWCCVLVLHDADTAGTGDPSGYQAEVEAVNSNM